MNEFRGIVGARFFPETESAREHAVGEMWTEGTFGTHMRAAEMRILLELIRRVFRGIGERFRHTALETLANDIRDERFLESFEIIEGEGAPKGIEHVMGVDQYYAIINWKSSGNPEDWARAEVLPVANPGHELDIIDEQGN